MGTTAVEVWWAGAHGDNCAPCARRCTPRSTPVLDWAHARDPRRDWQNLQALLDASMATAGPHLRDIITDERRLSARAADGAPAGHAPAGAGHGDRRRAAARRACRRLFPARHLLVQHRAAGGAPAPPGRAAACSATHLPGEELAVTVHGQGRVLGPRRPGHRRAPSGHARRVPAPSRVRSSRSGWTPWTPSGSASSPRRCSPSTWTGSHRRPVPDRLRELVCGRAVEKQGWKEESEEREDDGAKRGE